MARFVAILKRNRETDFPQTPAADLQYDAGYALPLGILREHKCVLVPEGQSLEFDPGTITRRWLHPHIGTEWHLLAFMELIEEAPAHG